MIREPAGTYDQIVIGGGMGGLACAGLAQLRGMKVALLEAHSKFGGCAGYFDRGPYTFDDGATALMGLAPGEPPVSRLNSNFLAVGSDVLGPGLWVVGDSVFPGQGTMATVLSAIRVIERITGERWDRIKRDPPPVLDSVSVSDSYNPYLGPTSIGR